MSIDEFLLLDETDQGIAVWEGVFMTERIYKGMTVQLYAVGDFYAELWYNARQNRTVRIRPFSTKRLPDSYWKKISLTQIAELL